ncbi:hypothetical protein C7H19_09980 [Aphanothece hegewaldii CCALA 016]|uniref:histidine kinase n=1 Tax=Aphanothece hegewaldii CCALA 016 TaxID=2107694 RepID=A0A2T1LYL0_9CHRO|nr:HAMP domain-containing sensor histidine kinase [Aphanothece hegewaldii]PSF37487.1 hypothetical protein C7H19_09980 [Aphanothece hegewaldii CCALA 016]
MFQSSRSRLLLYYLLVMAAILCLFSAAFFGLFSRSLYHQIDKNLETLARVAVPSFNQISQSSDYLNNLDEVPWREIFNSEQQSLEWFDSQERLLASQGNLKLVFPPKLGFWTLISDRELIPYQIRTFTLSITLDRSIQGQSPLKGYIRSSQTTEELQTVQNQFLWQLGISIIAVLGLIAISGLWLTKKALEPVMQSFKQLQQFTADASHELRGPLTAIKASVDVMRNHPERFEQKDAKKIAAISSATEQMTHLTQDLLFLARSEAKGKPTASEWHCLALDTLLDDLYDWFESAAEAKDIEFNCYFSGTTKIRGDQAQLSRLFSNLIENALNYTPQAGKITISLVQQNQSAKVSISDTGIGIPSDSLPFVFDRFWRADQARSHRQGGTGLGLAIAQAIARSHGGQITVSSKLGQGSCFQVILPLYRPETAKSMTQWSSWKTSILSKSLNTNQSLRLLKKSALMSAIIMLSILPPLILTITFNQVETFEGLKFPQGGISFADEVVYYQAKPQTQPIQLTISQNSLNNPIAALGIPNSQSQKRFFFFKQPHNVVNLSLGGSLILKFTDNLLTGNGNSTPDLWIFIGEQPTIEALAVAISQDGTIWQNIGFVDHQQEGIDLDRWGWHKNDFFSYVRLTYLPSTEKVAQYSNSNTVAIDAVGAVTSVKIVSSDTGLFPLNSPLTRSLIAGIVLLGVGLGARYGWKKTIKKRK